MSALAASAQTARRRLERWFMPRMEISMAQLLEAAAHWAASAQFLKSRPQAHSRLCIDSVRKLAALMEAFLRVRLSKLRMEIFMGQRVWAARAAALSLESPRRVNLQFSTLSAVNPVVRTAEIQRRDSFKRVTEISMELQRAAESLRETTVK